MTALSWARRGGVCGECGHLVADSAARCPGCAQSTGPFQPIAAVAVIMADPAGGTRLHITHTSPAGDTTSTTRPLSDDQARALSRPWRTAEATR